MVAVGPCQLLAVRVEKLVTGVHISTPLLHTVTVSATSTISDLLSAVPQEHLASLLPGSGPRFLLLHAPAGTGYTVISLDSRQLVTSVASEPPFYVVNVLSKFKTGVEHVILPCPQALGGKQFLVHPPSMNCTWLEDVLAHLASDKVIGSEPSALGYASYDPTLIDAKHTSPSGRATVFRIVKICRMLPILGGPGGVLALNYTHQFAEDHASVRELLLERYHEWIASPNLHAMPIELAEHLKLEKDCSTVQMHAALVVATRAVAMKFSIVGGPIIIGTEPSGEKSKPWVEGQEAWHATFLTCLDYSSYCGIDDPLFQRQLVAEGDRWGLVAKMTCDDHETSLPGLKLLINTPASLLSLIKYLLKCFLAGKKCCIVKHFGQSHNGFQLWLRLLKAERGIPHSVFSALAYTRLGDWEESIRLRKPSEQLKKSYSASLADESLDIPNLNVPKLREELGKRGLDAKGKKGDLVPRLQVAVENEKAERLEAARNAIPKLSHDELVARLLAHQMDTDGDDSELVARLLSTLDQKRVAAYGTGSDYAVHSQDASQDASQQATAAKLIARITKDVGSAPSVVQPQESASVCGSELQGCFDAAGLNVSAAQMESFQRCLAELNAPLQKAPADLPEESEAQPLSAIDPAKAKEDELDDAWEALSVDEKRRLIIASKMPPPPMPMPPHPMPASSATTAVPAEPAEHFRIEPGSVKRIVRITAPIDMVAGRDYALVLEPTGGYESYPLHPSVVKLQGQTMKLPIMVHPDAAQVPMRAVALLQEGSPLDGFSPVDVELPAVDSDSAAAGKRRRTS